MVEQVLIGKIVSSHGVRGLVNVDLYIESAEIISNLKSVNDENGDLLFNIENLVKHKNLYLVKLEGINDRNVSDELRGTKLYMNKENIPEVNDEDEFYVSDLEGLIVKDSKEENFGKVQNIFNFGAGDVLEIIHDSGEYFMLSFTKKAVPVVNIKEGFIIIDENCAISNKGEISCIK